MCLAIWVVSVKYERLSFRGKRQQSASLLPSVIGPTIMIVILRACNNIPNVAPIIERHSEQVQICERHSHNANANNIGETRRK